MYPVLVLGFSYNVSSSCPGVIIYILYHAVVLEFSCCASLSCHVVLILIIQFLSRSSHLRYVSLHLV